ncbi:NADPH-dependent FMN reductase [Pseudonocardia spinosispora]|uniref:NADPH-dependent FMN reductase n=1 Tax=Pseudonocardia spinosispora TaxID=103441 RepID=UPI000429F5DA|nr:NADPH-dependent FMN reductase [Pseudonocardia spinosispora]
MASTPRIAVVVGSTRPTRICREIATWAQTAAQPHSSLRYELVDLAEVGLPFLDEPLMASLQQYEHEHTRAWSRLVTSFAGFLFVLPQYNWGYPAVLKNALDFLYHEWHDKPASFLTYGTRGGNRAAAQLATVLQGLQMRVLDDHLEAVIAKTDVDDDWQLKDVEAILRPNLAQLRKIDIQMTEAVAGC